jgi:hypothetical protein
MGVRILGVLMFHCTLHILTDDERSVRGILVPPFDEGLVVSCLVANLPIYLGNIVVQPTVVYPEKNVGIEVIVVLSAVGITTHRRTLFVTINTKRRDTDLYPRLSLVDGLIELLDEEVDIISAPVVDIPDAIGVLAEEFLVGDGLALYRIGIEIVVHMDAIDIITTHDITRHLTDVITILGKTRIEDEEIIIAETTEGFTHCDMVGGELFGSLRLCSIGIDPGVELHATTMTLSDHPLERVPIWRRCYSLFAGQETTPWLELALIEGIALRTYLKDDDITTVFLEFVELVREGLLHLLGSQALELAIDTLYPRTTELTLGLGDKGGRNKK